MADLILQAGSLAATKTISNARLLEMADLLIGDMESLTNQEKIDRLLDIIIKMLLMKERNIRRYNAASAASAAVSEAALEGWE